MGNVSYSGGVLVAISFCIIVILCCIVILISKTCTYLWLAYKSEVIEALCKYELICQRKHHKKQNKPKGIIYLKSEQKDKVSSSCSEIKNVTLLSLVYREPYKIADQLVYHNDVVAIDEIVYGCGFIYSAGFRCFSEHKIKNNKRLRAYLKLGQMIVTGSESRYSSQGKIYYEGVYKLFRDKLKKEIRLTKFKIKLDFVYWLFTKNLCNFATNISKYIKYGNKNKH